MKRQFLSICRMFLPTHLRLPRFSCQGNVTRGCCDSQKNWSGCYLQIESIVLSYKMWCLSSRVSQDGGCHKKGYLVGDKKPSGGSCPRNGQTSLWAKRERGTSFHGLRYCCQPTLVRTHTHTHAGMQTSRVGGMAKGWQPAFSLHTESNIWPVRHPSSLGTDGHYRALLLSPAWHSYIQAKVWSSAGGVHGCKHAIFVMLQVAFFFSWGKILSLFFPSI